MAYDPRQLLVVSHRRHTENLVSEETVCRFHTNIWEGLASGKAFSSLEVTKLVCRDVVADPVCKHTKLLHPSELLWCFFWNTSTEYSAWHCLCGSLPWHVALALRDPYTFWLTFRGMQRRLLSFVSSLPGWQLVPWVLPAALKWLMLAAANRTNNIPRHLRNHWKVSWEFPRLGFSLLSQLFVSIFR